jgi:hypothetical protein
VRDIAFLFVDLALFLLAFVFKFLGIFHVAILDGLVFLALIRIALTPLLIQRALIA